MITCPYCHLPFAQCQCSLNEERAEAEGMAQFFTQMGKEIYDVETQDWATSQNH